MPRGEHQHLGVVEQLADLLGRALLALVLGGHPGLGGLLDQLLADRMDAGVELRARCRTRRGGVCGLLGQLGPELLERLHGRPAYGVRAAPASRPGPRGPGVAQVSSSPRIGRRVRAVSSAAEVAS